MDKKFNLALSLSMDAHDWGKYGKVLKISWEYMSLT